MFFGIVPSGRAAARRSKHCPLSSPDTHVVGSWLLSSVTSIWSPRNSILLCGYLGGQGLPIVTFSLQASDPFLGNLDRQFVAVQHKDKTGKRAGFARSCYSGLDGVLYLGHLHPRGLPVEDLGIRPGAIVANIGSVAAATSSGARMLV